MPGDRASTGATFALPVEGEGSFTFRRRQMRDEFRIGAEYCRLSEGVAGATPWFAGLCQAVATLRVLTVEAPPGWDLDKMDPLEPATYDRIIRVHQALREKEEFFRSGGVPQRTQKGEGTQQ